MAGALRDLLDLSGRRVLVTGAAHGLGAAIARAFAQHQAAPVLADRDAPALGDRAEELRAVAVAGIDVRDYDQADPASITRLISSVGDVDVLANNAGVVLMRPLLQTNDGALRRVIEVDLVGAIALATGIARRMVARGGGTIINIGSQMAFGGADGRGSTRPPNPGSPRSHGRQPSSGGGPGCASTASRPGACPREPPRHC